MAATINELASRLNLSKGSVSRILNHKGEGFSEETRRRVFTLAEELGYHPHPIARALATGRTGFVALWIKDIYSSYHAQVAHRMEDQLERGGFHVVIALHGRTEGAVSGAYLPVSGGIDGIIAHEHRWVGGSERYPSSIPIISTGVGGDPANRDYVGVALTAAATEAVRHLIAPGRTRIAYVMNDLEHRSRDPRYQAYLSVLADAGLLPETIDPPGEDRASVRAAVREYIREAGCPQALFCHNDDAAIASYRALCDLGIRVPDDVALFGCDGIEDTEYLSTPLSTIAQPLEAMCDTAWRFLERRLAEPDAPPQQIILQPTLVIRESSRI
jgi:LacI family transcriptional regulator